MARVSEAEIERIKAEISCERLAESAGVELKRHGKDLLGRCPFHDDKTPSLVITPSKNLWHCLGACQTGGSVIDWVMKREGVSFRHAVELLGAESSSLVVSAGAAKKVPKQATTRKLAGVLETGMSDDVLMERVVGFYEKTLQECPEALSYLEKRGLKHPELLKTFRLGFANRTLAYRLPAKNRKEGAALREQLQHVGILRASGHEHFNGSLVVPIFDAEGRVASMYGRKVGEKLRKGTPEHLYLPGPHRGVFNIHSFLASKELILCESLMDALTFWCAGFRNVTTSYGIEGFTPELKEALKEHGTKKVLIAYDRDEAGDRAADKLAVELNLMGIEAYRVRFPKGMDANEYALKVGPAEKSLEAALRAAEWMGQGKAPASDFPEHQGLVEGEQVTTQPPEPPQAEALGEATKEEVLEDSEGEAEPEESSIPSLVASSFLAAEPTPDASERSEGSVDELAFTLGHRRYRVRGLSKNQNPAALKINLLVQHTEDGTFHVDTLELYSARQRAAYIKQAAEELETEERAIKKDLGQVLLKLEELQGKQETGANEAENKPQMSEREREEALGLLRDPRLLDRILEDFDACGVVGEETNKLVGYLAATSRKLERPLAIVVQSSSAAGKSSLMDAVLQLMPEEERISYSAMTGQSLFYMGETNLGHKILSIAEEEGAERASYALKLLQSEGELTIASTGKDPATGRLVTEEYHVEGPVMIFLTTTAIEVDEELLNRCLVLTVNENREQTSAIHERQRASRTLAGLLQTQEKTRLLRLHQNAQRLIRPLHVVNPFAAQLTFPDHQTRLRRDHVKYLSLIDTVALVHQHQRAVRTVQHRGQALEYIEVTRADIAIANRLAHEVLGRTLDELPPQTRRLLEELDALVSCECEKRGLDRSDFRFSRREVRERTSWGDTQLKVHLNRLVELELLLVHRGRQGQGFQYELCFAEKAGAGPYLPGLLEVSELAEKEGTTTTSRGSGAHFAGAGRPLVGVRSGGSRREENDLSLQKTRDKSAGSATLPQTPRPGSQVNGTSYVPRSFVAGEARPVAAGEA